VFVSLHGIQPQYVSLPHKEQEVNEMRGRGEEHKERKMRVYSICCDDFLHGEQAFIVAENREKAVEIVIEALRKRIYHALSDITDELDDEEYEWYLEDALDEAEKIGLPMIEET